MTLEGLLNADKLNDYKTTVFQLQTRTITHDNQ